MLIKVITLNMWFDGPLLDSAIAFLIKENPDILFTQEVYYSDDLALEPRLRSFSQLKKALPQYDSFFSPAFGHVLPQGVVPMGNAIFARYPLEHRETFFYDVHYHDKFVIQPENYEFVPRNLQHASVTVNSDRVHLFNTHGIWGKDGGNTPRRTAMGKTVAEQVALHERVILGGDFNMDPDTEAIKLIEKHVQPVFPLEHLKTTFNVKRKTQPGYSTAVSDMLFTTTNIRHIEKTCPQVDISDHLPLIAVFEM
ncbi:MAG: endonuclease/exonuclease/phosphatase family protein [Patescibacteria group bacterium]|jgi:endonuclease/exonuclease/phosphatase family metal-dependent hydrolase